jgi:non-heme chloroperoxidase
VNVETDIAVLVPSGLASMNAHPNSHRDVVWPTALDEGPLPFQTRAQGVSCRSEHDEETVAFGAHLRPAPPAEGLPQQSSLSRQRDPIAIAQSLQQHGGTLDVSEDQRQSSDRRRHAHTLEYPTRAEQGTVANGRLRCFDAKMTLAYGRDGVGISYQFQGSGPLTLLFVHGWAGSGDYFRQTIDCLDASGLRTVTVDLRSHGQSDRADGYSLDDSAADVLKVADAVDAEKFILLGFSMSAKLAQYVAVQAPTRVVGLMLIAGCPATEIPFPPEILADWYSRVGNAAALSAVTQQYADLPISTQVLERIGEAAAGVPLAALSGTLDTCLTTSFADALHAIHIPIVVVGGTRDSIFTPDVLRAGVLPPLPQARLALLDCGHEIPVEMPTELAAITEGFLAGVNH